MQRASEGHGDIPDLRNTEQSANTELWTVQPVIASINETAFRSYAVVECEMKLFQPSSTAVLNNFNSVCGNLPEIISKLF